MRSNVCGSYILGEVFLIDESQNVFSFEGLNSELEKTVLFAGFQT